MLLIYCVCGCVRHTNTNQAKDMGRSDLVIPQTHTRTQCVHHALCMIKLDKASKTRKKRKMSDKPERMDHAIRMRRSRSASIVLTKKRVWWGIEFPKKKKRDGVTSW